MSALTFRNSRIAKQTSTIPQSQMLQPHGVHVSVHICVLVGPDKSNLRLVSVLVLSNIVYAVWHMIPQARI